MMLIISCLTHGLSRENCLHQFFSFMYMWAIRFMLNIYTGYLNPYLLKCKLALRFRFVYHFDIFYIAIEILTFLSYFHAIEDLF